MKVSPTEQRATRVDTVGLNPIIYTSLNAILLLGFRHKSSHNLLNKVRFNGSGTSDPPADSPAPTDPPPPTDPPSNVLTDPGSDIGYVPPGGSDDGSAID